MEMRDHDEFQGELQRILAAAGEQGIILRLIGALAIASHCSISRDLHSSMIRKISDIDFVSYRRFNYRIKKMFINLGYTPEERHIAYYGKHRQIYINEKKQIMTDVFFDKLEMCHVIDFRNRLELDSPTLPLADLVLTKMQIVQLNEKDLKDMCILLREHSLGDSDADVDSVNSNYIAEVLSRDWGFYHTVTNNLRKVADYAKSASELRIEDQSLITERINGLIERIDKKPKTIGWKLREKVGEKVRWYNEIEERIR